MLSWNVLWSTALTETVAPVFLVYASAMPWSRSLAGPEPLASLMPNLTGPALALAAPLPEVDGASSPHALRRVGTPSSAAAPSDPRRMERRSTPRTELGTVFERCCARGAGPAMGVSFDVLFLTHSIRNPHWYGECVAGLRPCQGCRRT